MIDVHKLQKTAAAVDADLIRARIAAMPVPLRALPSEQIGSLIAASLASGMIAATGKSHTAEEAIAVWREVKAAMVAQHAK